MVEKSVSKIEISTVVCSFKANFRIDLLKLAETFKPTENIVGLRYIKINKNTGEGVRFHVGDPCRGLKKKKKATKNSVKNGLSFRVLVDSGEQGERSEHMNMCERCAERYTTVNLFSTGSLNITGSVDVDTDPYISRDVVYDYLRTLPETIVSKKEAMDEYNSLDVANIKTKFSFLFGEDCSFDKTVFFDVFTQYPGIEVSTFDRKSMVFIPLEPLGLPNRCIKASVFSTGVIVMDSAKEKNEICYAYDCLKKMVFDNWETLVNKYEEEGELAIPLGPLA